MIGAHNKREQRELQAVKMWSTVTGEVRYVQEVRHIQEMRRHVIDQLPQVFADPEPDVASDVKLAIKVKSTDLVKKEPDNMPGNINSPKKVKLARVTPDGKNEILEILRFFVALATYVVGFGTLFLGIVFLWNLRIFEEAGLATKIVALLIGRVYMGTGLAMLLLVYQKHLRALGTLLLCEAVAEVVTMVLASNSGFELDFLIAVPIMGVKGLLGLWMVTNNE